MANVKAVKSNKAHSHKQAVPGVTLIATKPMHLAEVQHNVVGGKPATSGTPASLRRKGSKPKRNQGRR